MARANAHADNYEDLGKVYKQLRESEALSQRKVAKIANVSPLSIFRIEHGNNASLSMLKKVANSMGYNLKFELTKRPS